MSIEDDIYLTEDEFFSKLVPFFENEKAKLLAILGMDNKWRKLFSSLHLIYNVNHDLFLLRKTQRHLFLTDQSGDQVHSVHINQSLNESIYYAITSLLRTIFIEEVVTRLTPQKLGAYILRLLERNYLNVEKVVTSKYIRFRFISLNTSQGLLPLFPYKTNIVIPKVAGLDASEIRGWLGIEYQSGIDTTVLITSGQDIEGYNNFDIILDFRHLRNHLLNHFTSAITLYRQVLGITYEDIFKIIDLIGISSEAEVFWLQRELVSLPPSNGRAFENCMKKFLTTCFKPHFRKFVLRYQVPNQGGLRIRDFIIENTYSNSPFLQNLKEKGVDFLLFDAKNYDKELTSSDLDTFRQYLIENPTFGKFGIILSRKGASTNCHESIFRSLYDGMKIIVLDQEDLLIMLDDVMIGNSSLSLLESKFNDLVLKR